MAFRIGVSYEEHWSTTPKIFMKKLEAHELNKKHEYKTQDMMNYLLGKYISYATNAPKKYPKKPFLEDSFGKENKNMTVEEMERVIKRNNRILGGKFNKK